MGVAVRDNSGELTVEYSALDELRYRLGGVRETFDGAATPLASAYEELLAGAGEFQGDVRRGAVAFMLAWRETFSVCSESAAMVGGNIGSFVVDLQATDAGSVATYKL
jgi:hypothetical protein